ncbi:UNVERIFIED_ORG: hypothetical protein GGD47_002836 [Rhizobium etli]
MRTSVSTLLAVMALLTLGSLPSQAENPTRDKCTCDLEKGDPPENGAWVQNATSCWSTEIRERQWCDITVQTLAPAGASSQGPVVLQLFDRGSDPAAITTVMQDRFQEFLATASERGDNGLDVKRAAEAVPSILKANDEVIQQCVQAAVDGKRGFRMEGRDTLMCQVSEVSGWLRIDFRVGDAMVAYMIGSP